MFVVYFLQSVATRAFRRGGASCLLTAPHLRNVRALRVDHFSYPTHNRWYVVTYPYPYGPYTRPAPKISTPDFTSRQATPTIPHVYRTSQSHRPIIPLPSRPNGNRMGKLWVHRTGISAGRVGWSITEPTLTPVACEAIRYANWRLSGRTGEMLIKTCGCAASLSLFFLPSSFLLFLVPLFPRFLPATAKESAGALPGEARPPNDI